MDLEINPECVCKVPTEAYLEDFPIIENAGEMSFNSFFENYLLRNQACLLKNIAGNWEASKKWIIEGKMVNFEYLKETYGDCEVLAYDCNATYFNSHQTHILTVAAYINYWQNHNEKTNPCHAEQLLYLKDWHLRNAFPSDEFYKVPLFFASDWLNEFLVDTKKDDYRFVYMGPKATWTPLHADVFRSYSWSVNIVGTKEWILLPPGEEEKLKDSFNNLPHEITSTDGLTHFKVNQHAGDAIFVPSGWYHQVRNMEDTISINHNWINGCNLRYVYEHIQQHLREVRKEIADCSDDEHFAEKCQIVLKASLGMNLHDFLAFVKHIAEKRMDSLETNANLSKFDLLRIYHVVERMKHDENIENVNFSSQIQSLINQIEEKLQF